MKERTSHSFPRRTLRQAVAILALAGVILTGMPAGAEGQTSPRYDGETLFRGILFGVGPVGDLFPEVWKDARTMGYAPEDAAATAVRERLIAEIAHRDPAFLSAFAEDMQSGDQLRVQGAVGSAIKKLIDQMRADGMMDTSTNKGEVDHGVWIAVSVAVAAFVVIAAVFAAVAFWIPVHPGGGSGNTTDRSLEGDMYVQWITERLAI
ncbi:MAG: hypothetical protein ABI968_05690 [Acidobacteriota bacterium]